MRIYSFSTGFSPVSIPEEQCMSVDRREVYDAYLELFDAIVQSRFVVPASLKEMIDGYQNSAFKITEGLALNLNGTGFSSQTFQDNVRSAIPIVEKIKDDIAGGIILNSDVARFLLEHIEKALDVSHQFL
jgi:hypothetical protein